MSFPPSSSASDFLRLLTFVVLLAVHLLVPAAFQLTGCSDFLFWTCALNPPVLLFGVHRRSSMIELNQKVCTSEPEVCASQCLWASEGALVCEWDGVWELICHFFLHFGFFFVSYQQK